MEVFVIKGINDQKENMAKIAEWANKLSPDRVQLNTVVRPPAERFASAVSYSRLKELTKFFNSPVEIIAGFTSGDSDDFLVNAENILSLLKRRPCTITDISQVSGLNQNEISKYISRLLDSGKIQTIENKKKIYYFAVQDQG